MKCDVYSDKKEPSTGFGANSNRGQIVTNIGYYPGLLVTNLNDGFICLPVILPEFSLLKCQTDKSKLGVPR